MLVLPCISLVVTVGASARSARDGDTAARRSHARARGPFPLHIDEKEHELPRNYHQNYPSFG